MLSRSSTVILSTVLVMVAILSLTACEQTIPVAIDLSEISVSPGKDVMTGEEITLSVNASGSNLQFKWTAEKGTISSPNKPSVIYTAPDAPGSDTVTVEVISGEISKFRSIAINIIISPSTPSPTPTHTPTPIPTETATSTPTDTSTLTATPESPTETPTSTLTPTTSPTPTPTPTPEPPRPPCKGNTSEELLAEMWNALAQGDNEKALSCIYNIESRWAGTAKEQQAEKKQTNCENTPDPSDQAAMQDFSGKYWALNDVGLSLLTRGNILREQGQCSGAVDAYNLVITEYSCAYAWEPQGWFWSVAGAAQGELSAKCP